MLELNCLKKHESKVVNFAQNAIILQKQIKQK